jgi:L-asparaginase II
VFPLESQNPVLSVATRSGEVESFHRGAVAVFHDGELALKLGDIDRPVFARSAVKPLQALPLIERGVPARLSLPVEELAVLCASHDGTSRHVEAVRSFLQRGGLQESMLGCGPHAPFEKASRLAMAQSGQKPRKVHNNCSGKHTGFLHLAKECGDSLSDYLDPGSAAQKLVATAVAEMAGLSEPLATGIDGCGAPTFLMPLAALAKSFCQFANPQGLSSVRSNACRTIFQAVGQAPILLAGENRMCTALVRTWPGSAFAKNGAEGVYVVALAPDVRRRRFPGAIGLAIKIDDGAERGYQPVVIDLLRWLGAFESVCGVGAVPDSLQRFDRIPIHNTQKLVVGEVKPVVDWAQ